MCVRGLQMKHLLPCCCINDGGGMPRGNICYHVAAFCDSLLIGMQHYLVLRKLKFDLLTPSPRVVGGRGGSAGKIFATMLLHFVIPF